jgi:hypothetical protein
VPRILLALFLALQIAYTMAAQPAAPAPSAKSTSQKAPQPNDIFSGTISAMGPDSVSVVRKVPARADETRVFSIDQDTKVEGKLKVNARVSVRFKADGDGVIHALRIIVRPDVKTTAAPAKTTSSGPRR